MESLSLHQAGICGQVEGQQAVDKRLARHCMSGLVLTNIAVPLDITVKVDFAMLSSGHHQCQAQKRGLLWLIHSPVCQQQHSRKSLVQYTSQLMSTQMSLAMSPSSPVFQMQHAGSLSQQIGKRSRGWVPCAEHLCGCGRACCCTARPAVGRRMRWRQPWLQASCAA